MTWIPPFIIMLSLGFGAMLPVAIIAIRHHVKINRQGIVLDLANIFHTKSNNNSLSNILPSFEFVKYKYFLDESDIIKNNNNRLTINNEQSTFKDPRDIGNFALFISALPLLVLSFFLSFVSFSGIFSYLLGTFCDEQGSIICQISKIYMDPTKQSVWVLIFAFFGAHLFVARSLFRSVGNFDLGPASFVSSAIHLLFGVITAVIVISAGAQGLFDFVPASWSVAETLAATTAALAAAFIIGFIPELGLQTLMRRFRLWAFHSKDAEVAAAYHQTPIETIDGIDYEIRSRLNYFNIIAVQNLATANPIMLFVETPYGIYQIIDWVAQAQLCSAVGQKRVVGLWSIGIRTIFDLERAVLDEDVVSPQLISRIWRVLIAPSFEPTMTANPIKSAPSAPSADEQREAVKSIVSIIVDDLHVHRLRQICNRIELYLGEDAKRLRPLTKRNNTQRSRRWNRNEWALSRGHRRYG